eukprot:gnl/TRDRNA2_/TRDRNA2_42099_c0_seq1.p1 gnl/TRDRNA2_/TRDRNA2_42099_c0~~gnl/TRDRNA2_/TRDRNA2_42099_c0_seq1.p1  ORF type:complete len:126 (-),score=6.41 gnl/TRDRNA2_/TRDRNA2_42099_c0_seq1:37-414(-)
MLSFQHTASGLWLDVPSSLQTLSILSTVNLLCVPPVTARNDATYLGVCVCASHWSHTSVWPGTSTADDGPTAHSQRLVINFAVSSKLRSSMLTPRQQRRILFPGAGWSAPQVLPADTILHRSPQS